MRGERLLRLSVYNFFVSKDHTLTKERKKLWNCQWLLCVHWVGVGETKASSLCIMFIFIDKTTRHEVKLCVHSGSLSILSCAIPNSNTIDPQTTILFKVRNKEKRIFNFDDAEAHLPETKKNTEKNEFILLSKDTNTRNHVYVYQIVDDYWHDNAKFIVIDKTINIYNVIYIVMASDKNINTHKKWMIQRKKIVDHRETKLFTALILSHTQTHNCFSFFGVYYLRLLI